MADLDDDVILASYPYQIAENYRRYRNILARDSAGRFKKLLDLYEIVVKTLATIVIRRYLLDGIRDENIDNRVKAFGSPSIGSWVGLLRDIVHEYKKRDSSDLLFMTEIIDFHGAKIPGGQQSTVYQAVTKLVPFSNFKGKVSQTNSGLIDFCNNVRNYSLAHGALLSPEEGKSVTEAFEILIFHLLESVSFLRAFSFLYIEEVLVERSHFRYNAHQLTGTNLNRIDCTTSSDVSGGNLMDKELYFCQCETDDNTQNVIKTALSLSPLMIVSNCEKCNDLQVFVFNGKKGKSLQYLSYQCGHFYSPLSLKDDFSDIEKLIQGEVSAKELFLSKAIGVKSLSSSRISSYREVTLASKLADDGLQKVRESMPELALSFAKDALRLNPDSARAHYCCGLAQLAMLELEAALESTKMACKLGPKNVPYWLASAFVALEMGLHSEAQDYLNRIQDIDSTHYLANQLLVEIGEYKAKINAVSSEEERKEGAYGIVKMLFEKDDVEEVNIRAWIVEYPPWSWIERAPFHPVIGSFIVAVLFYLVVNIANIHRWTFLFHAKFCVVSAMIFLGCYGVFYVSGVLNRFYFALKKTVLLPPETFKRWYLIEVSRFWGSINLKAISDAPKEKRAEVVLSESDEDPEGESQRTSPLKSLVLRLSYKVKADLCIVGFFLLFWLVLIPLQYFCASDPLRFDIGVIIHQLAGTFEAYCCVWSIHFAIASFFFIPRVLNQPVRYFVDIPYDLSLAVFGKLFVQLSFIVPFCLFFFFAQHYLYQTHRLAFEANLLMVLFVFSSFFIQIVGPQVAIWSSLRNMKRRKISQFLISNERISESFMREPSDAIHKELIEKAEYSRFLAKRLPVFRLLVCNYASILVGLLEIGIMLAYLYLISNNIWFS